MPATSIFEEFSKDVVYSPFLQEDFDVQQHTTELVQGVVIAEHLNKLSLGLNRVERELEQHVGEHYQELLSQAAGIDTLEHSLSAIQARTQTLQAGVERVRARILDPYVRLEKHTLMLSRLQSSCELLRRLIRCLSITKRLNQLLENCPRELAKAATSISELEELYSDGELCGIHVLEGSERLVKTARADVEKQAREMLQKGANTYNQTQAGTALQVFHNLGCLGASVESVVDDLLNSLHSTIASTLDATRLAEAANPTKKGSAPGKSAMPGLGQTSQFRTALWSSLERLMEEIYNTVLQTHHLHKVLLKKRDPVSHVVFLTAVEQHCGRDLFSRVWTDTTQQLAQHFAQAAQGSHLVRQALEVDYPKLVRLYGDLWRRLESVTGEMRGLSDGNPALHSRKRGFYENVGEEKDSNDAIVTKSNSRNDGTNSSETEDPEQQLKASLLPLEAAFLSRSLSRLFDPVNLMFSSPTTPPTRQECDTLVRTIASEVNISSVDGTLSESVARNVLKSLQLLCTKCEHMMPADGDAIQVIGPVTEQQRTVVGTVNTLLYLRTQLERALSANLSHLSLTPQTHATLAKAVPVLEGVMQAGVTPLFDAITTAIQDILITMHQEDFSSSESSNKQQQCSLYMRELQAFLTRASTDYIAPYNPSIIITKFVERCARRCLSQFVCHASLLRPVGDGGKLRLAADFAQLEEGITALCSRASDLGEEYKLLRAVRPLLFLTPQHMIQVSSVGELIPHSLILHFLFARAPAELKSPHQSANWSVGQYLSWLDVHTGEAERLELIAGSLESYVARVRRTGSSHYHPVYPVMQQALEAGKSLATK